eukprot:SAG22_NODE_2139_length_2954_cov_1.248687_2_plen_50_part_00
MKSCWQILAATAVCCVLLPVNGQGDDELPAIAGYNPGTNVIEHTEIDLD